MSSGDPKKLKKCIPNDSQAINEKLNNFGKIMDKSVKVLSNAINSVKDEDYKTIENEEEVIKSMEDLIRLDNIKNKKIIEKNNKENVKPKSSNNRAKSQCKAKTVNKKEVKKSVVKKESNSSKKGSEIKIKTSVPSKVNQTKQKESTDVKKEQSTNLVYEDQLSVVTNEMKNCLLDLKGHLINLDAKKEDSFSNVIPDLEEAFQKSLNEKKSKTLPKLVEKPTTGKPIRAASKPKTAQDIINLKKTVRAKSVPKQTSKILQKPQLKTLQDLKLKATEAIRNKKTFTVRGRWDIIRRNLVKRGWVEKIVNEPGLDKDLRRMLYYSIPELNMLMRMDDMRERCEKAILSKYIGDHQVDLYWSTHFQYFQEYKNSAKLSLVNRFRRDVFSYTSKGGLCEGSKQEYWFRIPGVAGINHPRTYRASDPTDQQSFLKDYRITAALSLLKWVVKTCETKEQKVIGPTGKIPLEFFNFAAVECYKFIKTKKHEDIDVAITEAKEDEWKNFLDAFYKIMHIGNHFKSDKKTKEEDMVRKSNYILQTIEQYWPYLKMDGHMNIWILKPINSSMGIGIHVCRELNYMLNVIKNNPKTGYIVQKYIERPLLIHNTKFDIRQWFLITCASPLTIWMYKSCYLRFCAQTYNLNNLHEAIHLTNNSVQKKYMRKTFDPALPSYLMWDSKQFVKYLSDIGFPNAFQNTIQPDMKKCFTAAVLMLQDKLDKRPNSFELYGADFMITEDFKAWLIEINSNPALFDSTPVTKTMCPQVLEDVLKVVVDYPKDKKASTGNFELVYLQKEKHFQKTRPNLKLSGEPAPETYFAHSDSEITQTQPKIKPEKPLNEIKNTKESLYSFGKGMKETLENLQMLIKLERLRKSRRKTIGTITENQQEFISNETNCNTYLEFYEDTSSEDYKEALKITDKNNHLSQQINDKMDDEKLDDEEIKNTLNDLLELIKNEKERRMKNMKCDKNMSLNETLEMDAIIVKDVLQNLKETGNNEFLSRIKYATTD